MYPTLQKHKWLLPFFHVRRWCRILFKTGAAKARREMKASQSLSNEQKEKVSDLLKQLELSWSKASFTHTNQSWRLCEGCFCVFRNCYRNTSFTYEQAYLEIFVKPLDFFQVLWYTLSVFEIISLVSQIGGSCLLQDARFVTFVFRVQTIFTEVPHHEQRYS